MLVLLLNCCQLRKTDNRFAWRNTSCQYIYLISRCQLTLKWNIWTSLTIHGFWGIYSILWRFRLIFCTLPPKKMCLCRHITIIWSQNLKNVVCPYISFFVSDITENFNKNMLLKCAQKVVLNLRVISLTFLWYSIESLLELYTAE